MDIRVWVQCPADEEICGLDAEVAGIVYQFDDDGRPVGWAGMTLCPMAHQYRVARQTLEDIVSTSADTTGS